MANRDESTLKAFDQKWGERFRGSDNAERARRNFAAFFRLFPFEELGAAEGFDLGCGQGRHAAVVAGRVGKLHCIDPSPNGLAAARAALGTAGNVDFHLADVDSIPLADASQDFGYSLGVLHHIPDTQAALLQCCAKLKPGAPFLLYLYYDFENRPGWFRLLWRASDLARRAISRLPMPARKVACDAVAVGVYWPLARLAALLERSGIRSEWLPLASYRDARLGNMRVAALDRLGTPVEQRFSRASIRAMMERCGLHDIVIDPGPPYWVALGRRRKH